MPLMTFTCLHHPTPGEMVIEALVDICAVSDFASFIDVSLLA